MENKVLPIQSFLKRDIDDRNTEGGGKVEIPKWMDLKQVPSKANSFAKTLIKARKRLENKQRNNEFVPIVMTIKLNSEATAKWVREDIAAIFNQNQINIIGILDEGRIIVKFNDVAEMNTILNRILATALPSSNQKSKMAIASIDSMDDFEIVIDESVKESETIKIKLFDYHDKSLNDVLHKSFVSFCKQNQIEIFEAGYLSQPSIYCGNQVTVDSLSILKQFEGIREISAMPSFDCEESQIQFAEDIPVKQPQDNVNYPIVGVLDDGIADIGHLSPWLLSERSQTHLIEEDICRKHGTPVASIIEYGDVLEPHSNTGTEGCLLIDFPIKDKTTYQYENEILLNVREAIAANPDVKVWNMCIGTNNTAKTDSFSDYAIELDKIQDEYDVLICKSVGNCENYKKNAPVSRISESADSVRSLVVGSIAQAKHEFDLAEANQPSPFSRIGPGPAQIIKPDLVHYGGNAGIDDNGRETRTPILALTEDGHVDGFVGTSFSTPRVTSIAADLANKLGGEYSPLLVKALMIHSAQYPDGVTLDYADKLKYMGFGLPSNANLMLHNDPNEITLIMQDNLPKGHFIEILDFPFPKTFVDDQGYFKGCITVTLVTDTILDATQGAEYCQSNINVYLGTYDEKTERDITKSHIKNPIGASERKNLLNSTLYSKKAYNDLTSSFSSERLLVSYEDNFQPVKKWCINLSEMKPTPKSDFLESNRNWYLKLEGLFRQFVESKSARDYEVPNQDFCLIITIKDPEKQYPVYNEVMQQLSINGFVHDDVKVSENIHIGL